MFPDFNYPIQLKIFQKLGFIADFQIRVPQQSFRFINIIQFTADIQVTLKVLWGGFLYSLWIYPIVKIPS